MVSRAQPQRGEQSLNGNCLVESQLARDPVFGGLNNAIEETWGQGFSEFPSGVTPSSRHAPRTAPSHARLAGNESQMIKNPRAIALRSVAGPCFNRFRLEMTWLMP